MRRLIRENALPACGAVVALLAMSSLGIESRLPRDFRYESLAAFTALLHGHVATFLRLAPAYGGSLIERAPFVALKSLLGSGPEALYEAVALPCLIATAALALWLAARMRLAARAQPMIHAAEGDRAPAAPPDRAPRATGTPHASGRLARGLLIALCVANPFALEALRSGHPEELLGAALCVCAVFLAGSGRGLAAGIVLGLAIANKEWALLAIAPALLALPGRHPGRAPAGRHGLGALRRSALSFPVRQSALLVLGATVSAALLLAPLLLVPGGAFYAEAAAAAAPANIYIFMPWSLWWFLGSPGGVPAGSATGRFVVEHHHAVGWIAPGYRVAPAWVASISHPSILIVGAALGGAALWQRSRMSAHQSAPARAPKGGRAPISTAGDRDRLSAAFTLLALVMLARCLLDTWDNLYYPLPCLLALLALDAHRAPGRPPLLAGGLAALGVASFTWLPPLISPDLQSLFFLGWSLPLALYLSIELFAPARARRPGGVIAQSASLLGAGGKEAAQSSISSRGSVVRMRFPAS